MQRNNPWPTTPERRMSRHRIAMAFCAVVMTVGAMTVPMSATARAAGYVSQPPEMNLACHGSLLGTPLRAPIVGIVSPAIDPGGYWLVASDGGVFAFGNTHFYGSTGGMTLNKPIVGMATTSDGKGYWLVASDGGIFTFGDAHFYGSTGGTTLNQPIIGMQRTFDGRGYWLAAADAGVFAFGDAPYLGGGPITQDNSTPTDFSAFAADTFGNGYILGDQSRAFLLNFGDAKYYGLGSTPADSSPLAGLTQPFATQSYFSYWEATQAGGVSLLTSTAQTTC